MKVILMNQNTKVLSGELESDNSFSKIYEYYNIDYAPLKVHTAYYSKSISNLKAINSWFSERSIPLWRDNIENLLRNLNISSSKELLDKAYGLSLSDQYWIKREEDKILWKDINFFDNNFKYKKYLKASLKYSNEVSNIDKKSPNNTTDGMVKKAWIIDKNNNRVLVKGAYTDACLEPISEYMTSLICNRLNISYCDYTLDIIDNELVCKCNNFLNKDEEIITAFDILGSEHKDNNTSYYNHYINILNKHGIMDAQDKLSDMYLIDYLLMNTDRHMKNYGIIRNVKTLKWERVTPMFDTGNSMQSDVIEPFIDFYNDRYKFFYSRKTLNDILKYINISKYDLSLLDDLVDELSNIIDKYSDIIKLNDIRKNKTIEGFKLRIDMLKKYQKSVA